MTLASVLGVLTFLFLIIRLAPGDPASLLLGDYAGSVSAEELLNIRKRLGVDKPLYVQYFNYLSHSLQGDLGRSFRTGRAVSSEIAGNITPTLTLAGAGIMIAIMVGIPAGVYSATRRGSWHDLVGMTLASAAFAAPNFWFAIILIYVFAYRLGWFPIFGSGAGQDSLTVLHHLVLPAAAIGLRYAALIARMSRSAMLEVLSADYVRTALAKGLTRRRVLYKHALQNASIPIVTVIGLEAAFLLGGTVVVESVFARPGLGKLLFDAMFARDYPVVQGVVVFFAVLVVLLNWIVDMVYAMLDPRVRYT